MRSKYSAGFVIAARTSILILICVASTLARAQSPLTDVETPHIDKIDPPGWWTGLPDPMLLAHGEHLRGAHFAIAGKGIRLIRWQTSSNGHWAFLWLSTRGAASQTIKLSAFNARGRASHAFVLAPRSTNTREHLGFSPSDVMYLIMTDRFARDESVPAPSGLDRTKPRGWHGGNLRGIEQHLDYLKQLGVTTVWTTPVASNGSMPDSYHGYAATDLYAVDPHFGTLADYRHLSNALHARGMKLVIDLVPNHIGVQHPWISDPPAPEWLHGTFEQHIGAQYDFAQLVDPHAPESAWRAITRGWFTDAMPDLNQENPLVAAYLTQNALWWVESAGLDGIRLDTFPYVGRAFWHDFHAALHNAYPHLTTVGEVFNGDPQITSFFAGGMPHRTIDTGLDTPFDFPVYFTLRNVLFDGKPMTDLAAIMRQDALYPHPERLVPFIGNHDTMRFFTAAHESVPKLRLALGILATLRGMPQLYSGDEIAMAGGDDPDNRRDFPGGFAGDAQNAFTAAGRTPLQQDVIAWTSGLLDLRKTHPALREGVQQNLFATGDAFAFVRTEDPQGCSSDHLRERVLVVINKAAQSSPVAFAVDGTALAGCTEFQPLAPASGPVPGISAGRFQVAAEAESMSLYSVR